MGLAVTSAIHQTITNWITEEPNIENSYPSQKKR